MARLFRLFHRRERGQVLMFGALLLPVLLGMTAMAVDVGSYADDRRTLQNAADSIALAAAQVLPDAGAAQSTGQEWATKNGINLNEVTIVVSGGTTAPKVSVDINRNHKFAFIRALGVTSKDVGAHAAAVKASFGGGSGIVPWSVTQGTVDAAGQGNLVTMKYDATGGDVGNFGAIKIDGRGGDVYGDTAKYGSTTMACAISAPNCSASSCPGSYPDVCAETSPDQPPACDGPDCFPETGVIVGKTADAVDFRVDPQYTSTTCDTFDEAFGPPDNGKYHLNPDCNPWIDGPGKCLTNTSVCSRRVVIIPVVDDFGNGASDPATVQRFALLFLEGYDSGKCQGNDCEIKGRFVQADLSLPALAGTYDPQASIHFAKLSE